MTTREQDQYPIDAGSHDQDWDAGEWVEVDDHADLARAREIGCRS